MFNLDELAAPTRLDVTQDLNFILAQLIEEFSKNVLAKLSPDFVFVIDMFKNYFKKYLPKLSEFLVRRVFSFFPKNLDCPAPETTEPIPPTRTMEPALMVSVVAILLSVLALSGSLVLWYTRRQKTYSLPDTVAYNNQPRNSPRVARLSVNGEVAK